MNRECDKLDDALARDLDNSSRADFLAHLDDCAECRDAIELQERMDCLLRDAVARFEPVPTAIACRVQAIARRRRQSRLAIGAAAIAAAIGMIWLWRGDTEPPIVPSAVIEARILVRAPEPVPTRIAFPGNQDLIVIPEASDSPRVTIVRIYADFGKAVREHVENSSQNGIGD